MKLLEDTNLDEKQRKYLKRSKLASKNLLQIINNILDFSKLKKNKFEREDINFNLSEYLEDIKQVFTYNARSKGLYFKLDIQEDFPKRLSGDITKLSQVLINLISNAIKFTSKGGVTLKASYKKLEDNKIHKIIDTINPELRSIDDVNGKKRKREFFQMSKEQAYTLFECIAEISGTKDRLHLVKATENDIKAEVEASEIREMSVNRHHFKNIEFYSSLTNKYYYTRTSKQGTLSVFEKDTNTEIPNNSSPSKKQIVLQALKDLNADVNDGLTLYQLEHRLEKIVNSSNNISE